MQPPFDRTPRAWDSGGNSWEWGRREQLRRGLWVKEPASVTERGSRRAGGRVGTAARRDSREPSPRAGEARKRPHSRVLGPALGVAGGHKRALCREGGRWREQSRRPRLRAHCHPVTPSPGLARGAVSPGTRPGPPVARVAPQLFGWEVKVQGPDTTKGVGKAACSPGPPGPSNNP